MNRLPIEILPFIIQHLSQRRQDLVACTLVSRSFYICTIPILWRVYTDHNRKNEPLSILDDRHHHHHPMITYVRKIKLVKRWNDTNLLQFMPLVNSYVKDITVEDGYDLTDKSLQHLPQHWPHLTTLHLVGVSVTQTTMAAIGQRCHFLECLELINCRSLTSGMFAPFVTLRLNKDDEYTTAIPLRKLTLSSHVGLHPPWNDQTLTDLAQLPLTHIELQGASWRFMHALLSCSRPWWPHLSSIRLQNMDRLGDDDQHLIQFLKCHPTLTHVGIQGSVMTDTTLEAMTRFLPRLKWLDLTWSDEVTFKGILCLVRHCPLLEFIILEHCKVLQWSFPRDVIHPDDIVPYYGDVLRLSLQSIHAIRQIGLQEDNENDDENDDDYQIWLRTWKRSFVNLQIPGGDVAE